MYAQLLVFLIVVLHVGLSPDVVVLVPHWCLSDTPRSERLCGWWVHLPRVCSLHLLALFRCAGFIHFQEVSPVSPVLSVTYFDEVASVIQSFGACPFGPAFLAKQVLCVDCNETSDAALLPVVRGPLLLCRTCCNSLPAIGSSVLHHLPISLCAGLVPMPAVGVFRQCSSARYSDWPESLHFLNRCFTIFMEFSAFPFDWA